MADIAVEKWKEHSELTEIYPGPDIRHSFSALKDLLFF
jgi:hypothetical protein